MNVLEAYTDDHLRELIDSNDSCHDITDEEYERLLSVIASFTNEPQSRDEQPALIICGSWFNYAESTFGIEDGAVNRIAIGWYNEEISSEKGALLFENVEIVQRQWLQTGDGRRRQTRTYEDEQYDDSLWVPKSITDYLCIVTLSEELL